MFKPILILALGKTIIKASYACLIIHISRKAKID
jgi:hypothetical protein